MILGPPVPDLTRIDRDSWREVLVLPHSARMDAALHPGLDRDGRDVSFDLAMALPDPPSETASAALLQGPRIPVPPARPSRAGHQVNVRVAQESVLADHDAAMDRARHPDRVRP